MHHHEYFQLEPRELQILVLLKASVDLHLRLRVDVRRHGLRDDALVPQAAIQAARAP